MDMILGLGGCWRNKGKPLVWGYPESRPLGSVGFSPQASTESPGTEEVKLEL